MVDANPDAEKFICTGIRFASAPTSENITVRARAKAACAYAKQLNPALSTWYQNKPTQARSYAGKVLLTIETKVSSYSVTENHNFTGELANIGKKGVYQQIWVPSDQPATVDALILHYYLDGTYEFGFSPKESAQRPGATEFSLEFDLAADGVTDQRLSGPIPQEGKSLSLMTEPLQATAEACLAQVSKYSGIRYVFVKLAADCFGAVSSVGIKVSTGQSGDGKQYWPSPESEILAFKAGWREIFECNKYREKMIIEDQGQPWSCAYSNKSQIYEWSDSIGAAQIYARTKVERAYFGCLSNTDRLSGHAKMSANGKSLTLTGALLYGVQIQAFDCITRIINLPTSDYDSIMRTRAIDGTKRASWLTRSAEWTYHPSYGLSITFIEK